MCIVLSRRSKLWMAAIVVAGLGLFIWSKAVNLGVTDLPAGAVSSPIRIIPPEINCYRVQNRPDALAEVTIKNDGRESVNLLDATASCGCTLPKLMPERTIAPGKSVKLAVQVSPPGYGLKTSIVTIRTDSRQAPTIHVPIHLHGIALKPPFISFAPADIRVDSITGNTSTTKIFQVTSVESPGKAWLTGFKTSVPDVLLRAPKLVKEEQLDGTTLLRNYTIEFEVPMVESDHTFWLTPIAITEATKPSHPIRVNVSQVASIRAIPSSIMFTHSTERAQATKRIILVPADEERWEITSIDFDAAWLDVKQVGRKETSRNRQIEIAAKAPSLTDISPKQTEIRIRTSHLKCPEIVVRVTGVVKTKVR